MSDKNTHVKSTFQSQPPNNEKDSAPGDEQVNMSVATKSNVQEIDIIPGTKNDPYWRYRIIKQTILCLAWFGIGFYNEIIGPTLPDLKDRIGVNYEVISQALIAKSIGSMLGAIMGGFIHERYYKHSVLFIACGLWLGAVSTVIIPFGGYLPVVALLFVFSGISEGVINSGGNTLVMDLWKDRTAAPMSAVHFSFGVGAILAPQIARPFLSPDARNQNDDLISTAAPTTLAWNTTGPTPVGSTIEYGYAIVSCLALVFGFCVLGVYLKGPPEGFEIRKPSEKWSEMVRPASCGYGHTFFAVELLILLFWYFIHAIGGERTISKFLFSFAVESEVQFTKAEASSLQTAFWGSFTAGRMLGIPISRFVPLWAFMLVDALGATVVGIVMSVYAHNNRLALWVTSCFMGLFISVAFPNGMSWANLYLEMNNVSVMILIIGGACGGFIYQYLSGFLFERDPRNLPYIMIGFGGCLLLGFVVMQSLAVVHGRRIHGHGETQTEKDEEKENETGLPVAEFQVAPRHKPGQENVAFENTHM